MTILYKIWVGYTTLSVDSEKIKKIEKKIILTFYFEIQKIAKSPHFRCHVFYEIINQISNEHNILRQEGLNYLFKKNCCI